MKIKPEQIKELPRKNMEFSVGLTTTHMTRFEDSIGIHSKFISDAYCNYAYIENWDEKMVPVYDGFFYMHGLKNINFYITDQTKPKNLEDKFKKWGYRLEYREAFMVLKKPIRNKNKIIIKEIETEKEQKNYLKVFDEVYCKSTEGVYANIEKGYLKAVKNYLKNYKQQKSDYIAYVSDKAVGIVSVLFDKDYALIVGLAVLKEERGKGIAKGLLEEVYSNFKDKIIFLVTEKDSENEIIYKNVGFKTELATSCYSTKINI